jgi:hypothetical protein
LRPAPTRLPAAVWSEAPQHIANRPTLIFVRPPPWKTNRGDSSKATVRGSGPARQITFGEQKLQSRHNHFISIFSVF